MPMRMKFGPFPIITAASIGGIFLIISLTACQRCADIFKHRFAPEPKDEPKDEPKGDEAKGGKSQFEQAMDQGKHPEVGPDGGQASGDDAERQQRVAAILGAQSAATGRKFTTDKAA